MRRANASNRARISKYYNGRVLANLNGADGEHMRCRFQLVRPQSGMRHDRKQFRVRDDRFCFGDAVTLADICLVPLLVNARRFGVDLRWLPLICAVDGRMG